MPIISKVLFLTTLVVAAIHAQLTLDEEWQKYKFEFNKDYSNSVMGEDSRKMNFKNTLQIINAHNEQFNKGLVAFEQGLNEFSDWSEDEFSKLNSLKVDLTLNSSSDEWSAPQGNEYPQNLDWRTRGYVTPVKNQGHCGSCYIFGAIGAVEGMLKKASKQLVSLSEQNILDCNRPFTCDGGNQIDVYEFIIKEGGVDTEKSYPYIGRKSSKCHFNAKTIGAKVSGYEKIKRGDEDALKAAIATQGPISISIQANHKSLMNYKNGIWTEPTCNKEKLDHAVLAVGYGTDPKTKQDYYWVKNSWGTKWGMSGYFKMARNNGDKCGQASDATFPKP
uniref:Pept_C1 domain-containing protein n=1 Tax=Rhabditophanes sp. KR3021 TaxID=114890 RepID=A0AC35TTN8_9BILA